MSPLRREDGHTLPELISALLMGTIIVLATFALLDHVMKRTGETQARVEATQRGRMLMDTMTRALRSQVCLGAAIPPMVEADASTVTYYADLGDGSTPPNKYVLTYDPTSHKVTQATYAGIGMPPGTTFAASPTHIKELADNVYQDGGTNIFRYYAFDTGTPPTTALNLPPKVGAGDLGRVARISITYVEKAGLGSAISPASVSFQDDVFVRAADPNDPAPYPSCA